MEIKIFDTQEQLDMSAAEIFVDLVNQKPNAVLGLATGSTPIGIYEQLVNSFKQNKVSFKDATTFNLDEYVGLPPENDQSYAYYMYKHLFSHIDIPANQINLLNGMTDDVEAECSQFEAKLAARPLDIQLLGIGHNGHIAFNEPDDNLSSKTRIIKLNAETIKANSRFFASADEVPTHAMTMGIGSILKANKILLVVRGADKAEIVKKALTGPITTQVPASLLQTHARVTVLLDRDAGRMLG